MTAALQILHELPPAIETGGERYPSRLWAALDRRGVEVTTVAISRGRVIHQRTSEGYHRIRLRDLVDEVDRTDLIHVHSFNTGAFDVSAVMAGARRKPLVLTDYGSGTYAPGRVFGRARLRGVTGLAAISRWSAFNDLRWPSHKPSRILYGGGDHIGTVPAGARGPKQFDFLVVGRLLPHKGLHIAVDSLPAGASLVVAGPRASSDPEYVRELEARVADGSVRFVFDASDTDLVGLYDQARFTLSCAVSSYRHKQYARPELLGLTMLESIHRGTPCAGSRIAGVGEVLTDLGMPTAEPGSVPAWQQLLSTLHNMSPSDYEALALRAEARASDFTWDAAAARTDDLYAEVAGAGAR